MQSSSRSQKTDSTPGLYQFNLSSCWQGSRTFQTAWQRTQRNQFASSGHLSPPLLLLLQVSLHQQKLRQQPPQLKLQVQFHLWLSAAAPLRQKPGFLLQHAVPQQGLQSYRRCSRQHSGLPPHPLPSLQTLFLWILFKYANAECSGPHTNKLTNATR
jgi:hypothetical protein